jgi:predicted flap endonuclease-1-like 5' DNA nuclease
MVMAKIEDIEGIGVSFGAKLKAAGVSSVEGLLKLGSSPAGRKQLEEKTGIEHKLILEWVNLADLYRIKGIGAEYSDLLEEAGVDTVAELAQRNPENLFATLQAKNEEKKLVRRLPTQKQVEVWVAEAKALPKVVTY